MTVIKQQTYKTDGNEIGVYVNSFELEAAQEFMQDILELESDPLLSDIIVYVTSYGGDASGLAAMIETVRSSKKNIHVVGMGYNYSAGGLLVMTGPIGNRWIGKNGSLHIHEVQDIIVGSTSDIKRATKHLETMQKKLFDLLIQNSLLTPISLKNRIRENDGEWLISPQEALDLQLVDKIGMPKVKVSTTWELVYE